MAINIGSAKQAPSIANEQPMTDPTGRNRLRAACAVATATMVDMGDNDPLTDAYRAVAAARLPPGWGIPSWHRHNNRTYWFDTAAGFTTWRLPDRPTGQAPLADDTPSENGPRASAAAA